MCKNLFTGRIVQNIVEIIILFVFFSFHNLKIRLSVIRKDPLFGSFDLLGLTDPQFQQLRYCFVFVRTLGLLLLNLENLLISI